MIVKDSTQLLRFSTPIGDIKESIKDTEVVNEDFLSVIESSITSEIEKSKEPEHNFSENGFDIQEGPIEFHSLLNFNVSGINANFGFKDSKTYSQKTQRWLGIVESIKEKKFTAKLEDLTNGGTYEVGEFDYQDVSPEDLSLLDIGAAFYWSIGYNLSNTQVRKESIIRFKRSSILDMDTLDRIKDDADSKFDRLREK